MRRIKERILGEIKVLKNPMIFSGIIFGILMQFFHNVAHNYVYFLAGHYKVYGGPSGQLVDLGFEALQPSIAHLSFLPSNGCLYALALVCLAVLLSPLRKSCVYFVQIIWRSLLVCSITIVLRCVSFLITILPSPAPQCEKSLFDPPSSAVEIFFKFDTENGCSDLIFSSHMMYGLLATCVVVHYANRYQNLLAALCLSINIAEGFCIVAQERHYSIDVWTSFYAVPLTWIAFLHFVPNDPPGNIFNTNKPPPPPPASFGENIINHV